MNLILIEFLFFLAMAPGILLVLYFYWRDKYEREPFMRLVIAFLLGMASIIPAIILELIIGGKSLFSMVNLSIAEKFILAFIVIGVSEEISKFIFLFFYGYRSREFNEPFDGIVYGTVISLGFATVENLLYVLPGGIFVGVSRMIFAVPGHALFGGLMGYFVGRAKFFADQRRRTRYILGGLLLAVLTHGLYDFLLFVGGVIPVTLFIILFIAGWIVFFVLMKKSLRLSPFRRRDENSRLIS